VRAQPAKAKTPPLVLSGSMATHPIRIIGIDPGLRRTGWGIIVAEGARLSYVASGLITSDSEEALAYRLRALHAGLIEVISRFAPEEAAVEETFVNANGQSTLKLGHARGVALLAPARAGLPVAEYAARLVKKSIVGTGRAEKTQVAHMVRCLLPGARIAGADAADALAVAICHAHHRRLNAVLAGAGKMRFAGAR
jgi:crossover junction endodeoxyribonuclease RuvC